MLVLSRKIGRFIVIEHPDGTRVYVHVVDIRDGKVRLGVVAPPEVLIARSELLEPDRLTDGRSDAAARDRLAPMKRLPADPAA